jgi:hypothetical protein
MVFGEHVSVLFQYFNFDLVCDLEKTNNLMGFDHQSIFDWKSVNKGAFIKFSSDNVPIKEVGDVRIAFVRIAFVRKGRLKPVKVASVEVNSHL